ncbi:hypothetical protein [Mycobacterium lehmannii]|uniref:hypothetical protein n=1 Tax=Mycobacterium lehmannii TaxID=2048550 RepID=UPI000AA1C185|nr:hypothetical protein [Mycobacterium lehmannii]
MKSRGVTAAASVLAAGMVAVGIAAPAYGTDQITANAVGTYDAVYEWGTRTWVVTPCDGDAFQCVYVTQYHADDVERKSPSWSGNAYWQVGWWIMRGVLDRNAVTCEDGSQHDLVMNYAWDAASGKAIRSFHDPGLCGEAGNGANEFTLHRIGPPPPPPPLPA